MVKDFVQNAPQPMIDILVGLPIEKEFCHVDKIFETLCVITENLVNGNEKDNYM